MLNYLNELEALFDSYQNQINVEENNYKKIDLNVELLKIESKINYCVNLVINNFSVGNLLELAKKYISVDVINNAEEQAINHNYIVLGHMINTDAGQKEKLFNKINRILSIYPDIEKEEYKNTKGYKKIREMRENIAELDKHIDDTNNKRKTFIDYLTFEDKKTLVINILENSNIEKESLNPILDKAKEFKSSYDFMHEVKYPLSERVIELTADKDSSLAKYIIDNEEHIKRFTAVSSSEVISDSFTSRVGRVEHQFTKDRRKEFSEIAKEKKIDDITNELGQFSSKKVYYHRENYDRFVECIKEIKTTDETKEKIKKLLKKLDSLDIVNEHADAGESAYKEYGFTKFLDVRKEFIDAMNKKPADEEVIKNALERLKKEEAKIYEMYALIKDELGDAYETMPSNVDSYRNASVPPCFKNNLALNAKFNSLFISLTFIKENKLNIDDFVDNPIKNVNHCVQENFQKCNLDNVLADKTKAEALLFLSNINNVPKFGDVVKYSRSFELLVKSETNEEYNKDNHITTIAVCGYNSDYSRAGSIGNDYFRFHPTEVVQNIFMAKKNDENRISYLDCYVSQNPIQDDVKTGLAYDERPTIVEKIKNDEDIVNTFYEALDTVSQYASKGENHKKDKSIALEIDDVFASLQEFSTKIIVALDLKGTSSGQKRGYPEKFVNDVCNVIINYKQVEALKDFNFRDDENRFDAIRHVTKNRKQLVTDLERKMNNSQKNKEDVFIREFERINKEIDALDEQADKIGEELEKGTTNQEIENIAFEQRKKFIELEKLQNKRLKELKEDVKNGMISKFYFEQRSEQIKLLINLKDQPALFKCDDKNYKNFNTYAKEVLKVNPKELNANKLDVEKGKYEELMKESIEEKRLFLLNKVLQSNGLSVNKSINFEKVEQIAIDENIEEMQQLSADLLKENQKINEYRHAIAVDINEQKIANNNKVIEKEVNENKKELV